MPDGSAAASGAGGAAGGDAAVDSAPDVVIDAGSPDDCPGQILIFSGAGPFTANASGGTPPTNAGTGSCGGAMAPDGVYRFTAPATGLATIDYSTTAFDGVLYLRTTCAASATELVCVDDVAGQGTETYQFEVTQGLDYFIWADAAGTNGGLFSLDVSVAPSEPVDSCPGEPVVFSGSGSSDRTASLSGNTSIRLPNTDGTCGAAGARDEVWAITADTDGIMTLDVTPSGGWNAAIYVQESTCGTGTEVSCVDAAAADGQETIEFWATNGTTYYLWVDGSGASDAGSYTFDARLSPEKTDDNCPGEAVTFVGSSSPRTFQVTGDTTQRWDDGMGTCNGQPARDVVYQVTPPVNGTLTFDLTPGSGFDGVMYVRQGNCASGSEVACRNVAGAGGVETHTFAADQGTNYFVFVDGATAGGAGSFTLDGTLVVAAPPERCPGETLTLSGSPLSTSVTGDLNMFVQDYAGTCEGTSGNGNDAVYHFNAPMSGTVTINLEPTSSFDPVLYVRSGNCAGTTEVACADNNGQGVGPARAEFAFPNVAAGNDYYVFVDTASSTVGAYTLSISY